MDDLARKRWMIGLHSSLSRTPWLVGEAARARGDRHLLKLPVLPQDSFHDAVGVMRNDCYRGARLVSVSFCERGALPGLTWLDVELLEPDMGADGQHRCLVTTADTTLGDILRSLRPGMSRTFWLGSEQFKVRLWPETKPITDPQAVEVLSDLVPA